MWLYTILAVICLTKSAFPAEIPTAVPPKDPASSGNNVDDDADEYYPSINWSDTFDWQLLKAISSDHKGNVLISPLSIKLALVMLYEGSTGSTEKQFQSVLQFPEEKKDVREKYKHLLEVLQDNRKHYVLNIGTSLFLDSSIPPKQQYAAIVKSSYDTDILPTNFSRPVEASHTINSWVDILTNGRIRELVSPDEIQSDALLIVANAVYFKGRWRRQFPNNNTHSGGFYVSPTEVVTVPYMSVTDTFHYAETKELDAKILRLPYKGQHFSLFIVLPNSKGGLSELLRNINLQTLKRQLFLMEKRTVDVVIPKFKFDFTSTYSKVLQDFGLNTIFSNTASFPGIARGVGSGTKWLFVNDIKQKAGIEVNEEGSTAYASTSIQLGNKFGEADLSFNATHPFLIFLEDQITGSILFAGKVENPLQSDPLPSRFGEGDSNKNTNVKPVTSAPASQGTNAQHNRPLQLNPVNPQDSIVNSVPSRFEDFDIKLLTKFDANRNYFISPASIKATLGMVLEGARGSCAEEIAGVLGLPVNAANSRDKLQRLIDDLTAKSQTTLLEVANGAFISNVYQVIPEYARNLKQYYSAEVESVNFTNNEAAARRINNWVNHVTRGLITDIITPSNFNSDATLVIANALYFKGKWKHEFDGTPSIKCFRSSKNNCVYTTMMQVTNNFKYKYLSNFDAQAIELPYGDGQYAMLVLLPSEKNNVRLLTEDLRRSSFAHIVNSLEPSEVNVNLPKFEIDYTADIVSDLRSLGIEEIFGEKANLSGIIAAGQIKIDNIVHKAKIEVNEKGTVAAAATGVIVIPLMGSSTPHFDASRPFLFFIYHVASNNIIFEGRCNEPTNAYDDIFLGPPQTSKPLPPPSATQNQKNQRQQPVDNTPTRQSFSQQGEHILLYPSNTVLNPANTVLRSEDSYNSAQNRQHNAGGFNQGRK